MQKHFNKAQRRQKGFSFLAIIIAVVFVIVVAVGGYYAYQYYSVLSNQEAGNIPNQTQNETSQNQNAQIENTITQTPPDETAGWKTFTDSQYGFEFKYPSSLTLSNNFSPAKDIDFGGVVGRPENAPAGFVETEPNIDSVADSYKVSKDPVTISSKVVNGLNVRIVFYGGRLNGLGFFIMQLPKPVNVGGANYAFIVVGNGNIPVIYIDQIISTFKFTK